MNIKKIEKRIIRNISSKRQITIPQPFFDELGFQEEVEFIKRGNELVIRPAKSEMDFSEEILKDLVVQGLSGEELVTEFKAVKSQLRPAAERMMKEARVAAKNRKNNGDKETEEIFGDLD